MKIKMIDLLAKIANKEKIPKKIKYRGYIWKYTSTIRGTGYQYYSAFFKTWQTLQNQVYLEECLNDEIEIIEENKKIEKMECSVESWFTPTQADIEIIKKVNELIDEIDNLKENKYE